MKLLLALNKPLTTDWEPRLSQLTHWAWCLTYNWNHSETVILYQRL